MSEVAMAEAARDEALAQVRVLQLQIDEASILAPFDGFVVRGDLFERRGATFRNGDPLFELVQSEPSDPNMIAVEAEVMVSERDIQRAKEAVSRRQQLAPDQRPFDGKLATSTLPRDSVNFRITRIVPEGQAKEGENVFKVYASLDQPAPWMLPGLAGEAQINIEPRSLAWTYTHRLWDWLVLKRWHWMP
jgi:multidrug efflux pump subunit AcrA (membrane-fusion protein)